MPKRSLVLLPLLFLLAVPSRSAQDPVTCGTHRDKGIEQLQFHRTGVERRAKEGARAQAPGALSYDVGDVAILEDSGDLVSIYNPFDLDLRTLTFRPVSGGYRFELGGATYDQAAAAGGTFLANLGDDDSREIPLPFAFSIYGSSYQKLHVNSDGH